MQNRMHFTSINRTQADKKELKYSVPQESVLGPLLFRSSMNGLHKVEFSTVHHFTDDTNMLLIEKSLKKNEQIHK